MTFGSVLISLSACAFWGFVLTKLFIAVFNPRDFSRAFYRLTHRLCAAHEALEAGLDAWDEYKERNSAAWQPHMPEAPARRYEVDDEAK